MRSPLTVVAVAGLSMVPTLAPGDFLLVRRGARPRVGDVVVVRHPGRPDLVVVKRVVRAVGPDQWCVEGDNPEVSDDSRDFGPVAVADVVGRVLCRYWPAGQVGRVR